MSRKYQHTKELLPQIKKMLDQGMTQKQIEAKLGLTGSRPVHELLKRERKKEIASHLHLSERTVTNYISYIYDKLHINSKKELEKYMFK